MTPLDAEAAAIVDLIATSPGPAYWECAPATARAMTAIPPGPRPQGITVTDRCLPVGGRDLPIRIYRPSGEPAATVVFFHGGGWVIGDLDSHDEQVARLTAASGSVWVSVDYALAPEHPFPAAVDDAVGAIDAILGGAAALGLPVHRWAVAGDSSGANLAAVAAITLRDRGGRAPDLQLLAYPVLDTDTTTASFTDHDGALLPAAAMRWYLDQYVPEAADRFDPRVAPLRTEDLGRLPPTVLLTAAHDVLHEQALRYADRLTAAGSEVHLIVEPALPHGFWALPIASARRSLQEVGALVGTRLHSVATPAGTAAPP